MLTKLIMKASVFAAFITAIYCVVSGVSVFQSLLRGLIVLAGFYVVLISFFLFLRMVFDPRRALEEEAEPGPEEEPDAGVDGPAMPVAVGAEIE